ncbi:hypothetical protein GCM10009838_11900 [Catenulispora subtropica]|uniref:Transposase n=1 Tax=Catenulispora subtropica TaxID=450798 RepID=A0ABN2QSX5_9ACTN
MLCVRPRAHAHKETGVTIFEVPAARVEALGVLSGFRTSFYDCLTARGDALFELADALLCTNGPVKTLADLALAREHRRHRHHGLRDPVAHRGASPLLRAGPPAHAPLVAHLKNKLRRTTQDAHASASTARRSGTVPCGANPGHSSRRCGLLVG